MTEVFLAKNIAGCLVPVDHQSAEFLSGLKLGQGVTCRITKHRNIGFHRKFFALLNLAFESWEPGNLEYDGQPVQKEFDQFRNDVTVLAGYYESSVTLKGEVRLRAKSISFGSMKQEQFEKLYSAVIDIILQKILTNYTREDLDKVVEDILRFT